MTMTRYRIETIRDGEWTTEGLGDDVTFPTPEHAWRTIDAIGWDPDRLRVVEVEGYGADDPEPER
jgi:hypothetical protein